MTYYEETTPYETTPRGWGPGELETYLAGFVHVPELRGAIERNIPWTGRITPVAPPLQAVPVPLVPQPHYPAAYFPEEEEVEPQIMQAGLPVAGLAVMALGAIKALWARFGPVIVKAVIGGTAFGTVVKLITGGASDDTVIAIKGGKRRAKRYSIGANPRMRTLLKVAKRVDNIFASYDTRMRKFRGRIRGDGGRRYHRPPGGYYMSRAEREHAKGR